LQKAANSKESGSAKSQGAWEKEKRGGPRLGRRCVAWRTSPDYLIFPCKRLRIARKVGLQIPRRLGKKKSEAVPGSGRRCVAWRTSPDYLIFLAKGCE
jgi:hypothetical protein